MAFSKEFLQGLTERVEQLESCPSVELVVVAAQGSGGYRDIDHQNGFVASCLVLLLAVYSPWEFAPEMLLFWMVFGYVAGYLLSTRWDAPRRWLTSSRRRRRQVQMHARSAFVERKVATTRARSGLLLYLSEFERQGVLVPDVGVEAQLPRATLNELEAQWSKAASREELEKGVLDGLGRLGQPLAEALPRAEDDENELPNEVFVEVGL